jgi:hypothetical protein
MLRKCRHRGAALSGFTVGVDRSDNGEHTSTTRKAARNFGHHHKLLPFPPAFVTVAHAATRLRLRVVLFTV